jgi:hypothetical protein
VARRAALVQAGSVHLPRLTSRRSVAAARARRRHARPVGHDPARRTVTSPCASASDIGGSPRGGPEVGLDPAVLGEDPRRVTSLDYYVKDDGLAMCVECKWAEAGMGGCSCARDGGDPATGRCRDAVLNDRPLYWETARDVFGLPKRVDGKSCPLSPVYQAVRNAAAALRLRPPDGLAVFGLIYDADNPYFAGCGDWPGWAAMLSFVLDDAHPDLVFRAVSWQAEVVP